MKLCKSLYKVIIVGTCLLSSLNSLAAAKVNTIVARQKMEQLKQHDWILQIEAIRVLGKWQYAPAIPDLKNIVETHKNEWMKGNALVALAKIDKKVATPLAVEFVESPSAKLRQFAFEALALLGDASFLELSKAGLKDKDINVQYAALSAYAAIAKDKALAAVKSYLSKEKISAESYRNAVKAALHIATEDSYKLICEKFNKEKIDAVSRRAYISAITANVSVRHIPVMVFIASQFSSSEIEQHLIIKYLRTFDKKILADELQKNLKSCEPTQAAHTFWIASKLVPSAQMGDCIAEFLAAKGLQINQLQKALSSLSNYQMAPAKHQKLIEGFISHQDQRIQAAAIKGLLLCPEADLFALFKEIINGKSADIRSVALQALAEADGNRLPPPEGVTVYFKPLLPSGNEKLMAETINVISKYGSSQDALPAIEIFKKELAGADDGARHKIAMALGKICGESTMTSLSRAQGYLSDWMIIGTFMLDEPNPKGFEKVYEPETEIDFKKTYKAKYVWQSHRKKRRNAPAQKDSSRDVQWTGFGVNFGNGILSPAMATPPPHKETIAYCVSDVNSPIEQEVSLVISADDFVKVWLNGKEIMEMTKPVKKRRYNHLLPKENQKTVKVKLQAGKNRILVKSANVDGFWGFSIRCVDTRNKAIFLKSAFPKIKAE